MTIGLDAQNDFNNEILIDLQRVVTWKAATITRDQLTGDDSLAFASGTSKNWVFLKRSQKFLFDKEGVVELGDAYLMIPSTDTISVRDRVVVDGETYEITSSGEIMKRHFNGSLVYVYVVLKKVDGTQT